MTVSLFIQHSQCGRSIVRFQILPKYWDKGSFIFYYLHQSDSVVGVLNCVGSYYLKNQNLYHA
jgi:hypothetical protein